MFFASTFMSCTLHAYKRLGVFISVVYKVLLWVPGHVSLDCSWYFDVADESSSKSAGNGEMRDVAAC